jgi:hypothetical protein
MSFVDHARAFHADLALSLDVIYHLVEDDTYDRYMRHLFAAADRYVVIYSSNKNDLPASPHVRHRRFTDWIDQHQPQWQLSKHLRNQYPFDPHDPHDTSFADLYCFRRVTAVSSRGESEVSVLKDADA